MGFGITILGTIVVALATWRLPRFMSRLMVTILGAFAIACVAYWLSTLFSYSDEIESWSGFVIGIYFIAGALFGLWALLIMQIVKKVGAKRNAH
jgi:thiol:disulfide interchange protein